MRVVILRAWTPLPRGAVFSDLRLTGVGGTEFQLLQHARGLRLLGHDVSVVGVTKHDVFEEEVEFKGCSGKAEALELLATKYKDADVVLLNVVEDVSTLRAALPKARLVEVCQNGPHFENDPYIDIYAMVGTGQFAYYSSRYGRYRQKFSLLTSVPSWHAIYSKLEPVDEEDQIVWVGSPNKQGFRRWVKAMRLVMARWTTGRWVLCIPSYDLPSSPRAHEAFVGIDLPWDRVQFKNLPALELAREIARSKMLLASLGGEDGPVSYLDGHAAGVAVLCGDDIYGQYYNPAGLGLRCTTVNECVEAIQFLLQWPELRKRMGTMGRRWIAAHFTEVQQHQQLAQLMHLIELQRESNLPLPRARQSDRKRSLRYWLERMEIKYARAVAEREA